MKYDVQFRRGLSMALCLGLVLSGCAKREPLQEVSSSAVEEASLAEELLEPPDLSFETITEGIRLSETRALTVTRPEKETTTTSAENYYITGTSDPDEPLLLNGVVVENRGALGSFGVFSPLEEGDNVFVFTQGESRAEVTVIQAEGGTGTTQSLTQLKPDSDAAFRAGDGGFTLSCVGPSTATVTAQIGGQTLTLKQDATDAEGVPVTFSVPFEPEAVSGTQELGEVTYTLDWGGETKEYTSHGKLYAVGKSDDLVVRALDVSSTAFTGESDADDTYLATLKAGAVDRVEEIGASMYRLSMGGWVFKKTVEPLTDGTGYQNKATATAYSTGDRDETLVLSGAAVPPYTVAWSSDSFAITFYNLTSVGEVDVADSSLFSRASLAEEDGATTLTFAQREPDSLWGYLVEYKGGDTVLTLVPKPVAVEGEWPLRGITVSLDPGHGGSDPGALGVAFASGPNEEEINYACAQALERYLRELGATVQMIRTADSEKIELDDRLGLFQEQRADLIISLHSNSIPYTQDGTGPSGVEVYYYEDSAEPLATALCDAVAQRTGRKNRGARTGYYKITLNSHAPTALVEMGFLTNPEEYDNMRSLQEIYNVASAIGDSVVALLSPTPGPQPEDGAESITESQN